jgi:phosphoribosylformimino-5-aminoimidazole carboxamide ribotide isomerase
MSPFSIIPVLDLRHGDVVRARAGDRANYRPIVTPLARGSAPGAVLEGLLRLAPFRAVYVADLDAIAREGSHRGAIERLAEAAPGLRIWVDGGFATAAEAHQSAAAFVLPVLGSESLAGSGELDAARELFGTDGFVLSLDYRGGRFLGPPGIERRVELWPERVILMTLDRVGMDRGPDLAALEALIVRGRGRAVFAAGGVRDEADLTSLQKIGVSGVLVASALHDGRLPASALEAFLR